MSTTDASTSIPSNLVTPTSDLLKVDNSRTVNQELDKDAFINLLVTQMKYQDPLNPMDNQEMMAQMAQFSALEQMMNVAKAVEQQTAHSLIGQQVQYQYKDEAGNTQYAIGKIDYVKTQNGENLFGIGENEVKMDAIVAVIDPANIQSNTSAFDLIGKTVQGILKVKDAQGVERKVTIEGEVQGITMKNGATYVAIGEGASKVEVNFTDVQNIVEKPTLTGRWITGTYRDSEGKEQAIEGKVDYIRIDDKDTYACVNGQLVDFNAITSVTDLNKAQATTSAYDLIGKIVQGSFTQIDSEGTSQQVTIQGAVQKAKNSNGKSYVVLGTGSEQVELEASSVVSLDKSPALLGKWVNASYEDSTGTLKNVQGTVEYIQTVKGINYLYIDGQLVNSDHVISVKDNQ